MMSVGLTAVMVAVEFLEVGLTTLSKAAMNGGMNHFVFVLYSNGFAAIFLLLPASLFFYWKRSPPPLTCSIICRIFVLSLLRPLITCCYSDFKKKPFCISRPGLSRTTLKSLCIVGAAVIAFGFYSLIWGQAQEEKMVDDKAIFNNIKSSSLQSPLLKNKSMEV
ncbi:hypothetical protein Dsin_010297 [Dipteronia sinensis]|uniref:WAT1-related protein n=1 Tax=Dipteronia sinensis TaxID=43782 RepID=A0AAE0ATD8_9ROSI|nr:hypothetical protein Dsin_010297 [Dipteronia sinensis]